MAAELLFNRILIQGLCSSHLSFFPRKPFVKTQWIQQYSHTDTSHFPSNAAFCDNTLSAINSCLIFTKTENNSMTVIPLKDHNILSKIVANFFIWFGTRKSNRANPHGVMTKVQDCNLKVSKFNLRSRYFVYFRTNILGECMNQLWDKYYPCCSSIMIPFA